MSESSPESSPKSFHIVRVREVENLEDRAHAGYDWHGDRRGIYCSQAKSALPDRSDLKLDHGVSGTLCIYHCTIAKIYLANCMSKICKPNPQCELSNHIHPL